MTFNVWAMCESVIEIGTMLVLGLDLSFSLVRIKRQNLAIQFNRSHTVHHLVPEE